MTLNAGFEVWLQLAAWVLTVAFATGLLIVRIQDRATRALAYLLLMIAVATIAGNLGIMEADPAKAAFWQGLSPYFLFAAVVLSAYFPCVYPHRRWLGRHALGAGLMVAVAALAIGAYARDHTLWGTHDHAGPLFAFHGALTLTTSFIALALARDYLASPPGIRRRSVLLVTFAFTVFPSVHAGWDGLGAYAAPGAGVGPFLNWLFSAAALVPLIVVGTMAVRNWQRVRQDLPGPPGLVASIPILSFAGGLTAGILPHVASGAAALRIGTLLDAFECFGFVLLACYGIVKYQLFDIDLRIKWTIRRGTVAAIFIAAFFIVSETAQQFLGETLNSTYVGILAAGALVFAIAPLQRLAERVADSAMPGVNATPQYLDYRRLEVYRAALEGAYEDGDVTSRERAVLKRLRESLGIAAADANALEGDVRAALAGRPV